MEQPQKQHRLLWNLLQLKHLHCKTPANASDRHKETTNLLGTYRPPPILVHLNLIKTRFMATLHHHLITYFTASTYILTTFIFQWRNKYHSLCSYVSSAASSCLPATSSWVLLPRPHQLPRPIRHHHGPKCRLPWPQRRLFPLRPDQGPHHLVGRRKGQVVVVARAG